MILRILRENSQWALLWLLLLVSSLYARPPIPIDETRYLSVAWEMWHSGRFLVPHINGAPYSHKPPLLFWLIHLGWWLFGVNEWSARMTPPLFGLGAILLARGLATRLWPEDATVRRLVPFLLLGTFFWSLFATLTMFDMLVAFFALLALHGLLRVQAGRPGSGWALFALALALGILAKGPVILVYVAGPALLAPLWQERKMAAWPAWYGGFLAAVAVAVALVLSWAIPAARAGGEEYGQAILFGQTAGRMVHSFAHQRPSWWYAALLPLLLLPWTLCGCLWKGLARVPFRSLPERFCLTVLVPGFLVLSLVSGKQVHYLLPLLPLFFLLVARGLGLVADDARAGLPVLVAFFLLFGAALSILSLVPLQGGDASLLALVPSWLGLGPLLVALVLWIRRHAGTLTLVRTTATASVLLLVFFHLGLRAPLHQLYDAAGIFAGMHRVQERGLDIAVYPPRLADQFQFAARLSRPLVRQPILPREVTWAYHNREDYCLIFVKDAKDLWLLGQEGVKTRYSKGWLIFRPARGLYAEYLAMERRKTARQRAR
ncbi:MAG TPA: glycosyltransferase family 39 protein [Desulfobulbus sp.]|nr:glycosyltransferase family 39 protein [Desulfobulbus sp.]